MGERFLFELVRKVYICSPLSACQYSKHVLPAFCPSSPFLLRAKKKLFTPPRLPDESKSAKKLNSVAHSSPERASVSLTRKKNVGLRHVRVPRRTYGC